MSLTKEQPRAQFVTNIFMQVTRRRRRSNKDDEGNPPAYCLNIFCTRPTYQACRSSPSSRWTATLSNSPISSVPLLSTPTGAALLRTCTRLRRSNGRLPGDWFSSVTKRILYTGPFPGTSTVDEILSPEAVLVGIWALVFSSSSNF